MLMSPLVVCLNNFIILMNSILAPSVNMALPIVNNSNDGLLSTLSLLIRPRLLLGVYLRLLLFRNSWLTHFLTMQQSLLFWVNSVQREVSKELAGNDVFVKSLKRKVDNDNRAYKGEWKDNFALILPGFTNGKPMCLICNKVVAVCKT